MKQTTRNWLLGISIALMVLSLVALFLLMGLTVIFWVYANIFGALMLLMLRLESTAIDGISYAEFMANFVGSPMFYICLADLIILSGSIVMLVIAAKKGDRRHLPKKA